MLLNLYKINLALRLCKFLKYKISQCKCDDVLLKIHNIINILINILNQCLQNKTFERKSNVKIAIAKRLCFIVKQIYRDTIIYAEWKVFTDLCQQHPDIYESLMNKNIDAKTAHEWCSQSYNKCYHVFENKLTNLLNADEFADIQNNNSTLTNQDLFVKTLVEILAQYKTYTILINSLNERLASQQRIVENLKNEMTENKNILEGIALRGQIVSLRELTTLPNGIIPAKKGTSLKAISTDGDGSGAQITLFNGTIDIVSGGNGYKMNDIIYIKHNKKSYYLRVIDIAQKHIFAQKIELDDLNICVPVWIRLYKMIYPCGFDICIIQQIKDEIEEHGVQYVILKHQCLTEAYTTAMGNAF
tara:strand:+ start:1413 stop:2489 length:1077 start_codon:yes stop_codon:yes gene_type:complete